MRHMHPAETVTRPHIAQPATNALASKLFRPMCSSKQGISVKCAGHIALPNNFLVIVPARRPDRLGIFPVIRGYGFSICNMAADPGFIKYPANFIRRNYSQRSSMFTHCD